MYVIMTDGRIINKKYFNDKVQGKVSFEISELPKKHENYTYEIDHENKRITLKFFEKETKEITAPEQRLELIEQALLDLMLRGGTDV